MRTRGHYVELTRYTCDAFFGDADCNVAGPKYAGAPRYRMPIMLPLFSAVLAAMPSFGRGNGTHVRHPASAWSLNSLTAVFAKSLLLLSLTDCK